MPCSSNWLQLQGYRVKCIQNLYGNEKQFSLQMKSFTTYMYISVDLRSVFKLFENSYN